MDNQTPLNSDINMYRPVPIEIPPLPLTMVGMAIGGGEGTPPTFQSPVNAPPAPRAERRRRVILNPEEDSDDEDVVWPDAPGAPQPARGGGTSPIANNWPPNNEHAHADRESAVVLANNALSMSQNIAERWKLLQNAESALIASGVRSGTPHDSVLSAVRRALRDEHGL